MSVEIQASIISYSIELHQPILHLCRRNALKVLLSKKLAEKNQIWHTKDLRELRYRKVRLEPHEALLFCDKMVAAHSCIERYLSGVRHIELDYEDLFDGHSKLKAFARRKIAKSFQIADIPQIKSKYMKQTSVRLSEAIENFDEIREAFESSQHGFMVVDL